MTIDLLAFSCSQWLSDNWAELIRYSSTLGTWQWGLISASAVVFGFLCLRGTGLKM